MSEGIPQGWDEILVKDAFNLGRGRVISKIEIRDYPGVFPVYSSQSKNGGRMGSIGTYDFDGEYITWTTDGAYAGTVFYRQGKFNCTNVCGTLRDNNEYDIDLKYVALYLVTVAKKHVSYVGNPKLMNNTFGEIPFLSPPKPEQQKIASILTSVDDVIEKTESQINKLQDLKKGMMQELLTKGIGHTEFKDSPIGRIPKEWVVTKAVDCIKIIESGWSPQCDAVPAGTGQWGILKTTAVTWNGFDHTENKRLPESLQPRPQIQTQPRDVLITRAGPTERVGVVTYVDTVPERLILSDKLIRIRTSEEICVPEFFSVWFSGHAVQKYFNDRTTGLAQSQTNISQEIVRNAPMVLPEISEQEKVVSALSGVSKNIHKTTERFRHLLQLKKALMQDLLTGKVRVS